MNLHSLLRLVHEVILFAVARHLILGPRLTFSCCHGDIADSNPNLNQSAGKKKYSTYSTALGISLFSLGKLGSHQMESVHIST